MTTIETTGATIGRNKGVLTAARLNTVGAGLRLGFPWMLIAALLLFNVLLFVLAGGEVNDGNATGGLAIPYVAVTVSYLQVMTQTFGFALSLGITRRDFYLGSGAVVVGESLLHAVALTVLLAIERATGGWGVNMRFFGVPFLVQDNPVTQVLAYAGPLLSLSFLGMLVGVVFKRWGQIGIWAALIVSIVVFGGLALLATWQQWWPAVGAFFTTTPTILLTVAYPVLIGLVAAVGGYLLVRRATP